MKPPPAQHTGGGGGTLRRSGSLLLTGNLRQNALPPQAPSPSATKQSDLLRHLRQIWWAQRTAGIPLPAEPGLILITGGKP